MNLAKYDNVEGQPSACAMQCGTGPRSRLGPDHILGPHPGVELFFRQQPQHQRRLCQGGAFGESLLRRFGCIIVADVRVEGGEGASLRGFLIQDGVWSILLGF